MSNGAIGRRGRLGGIPNEISRAAEEYRNSIKPPYDGDDICSAYETSAILERNTKYKVTSKICYCVIVGCHGSTIFDCLDCKESHTIEDETKLLTKDQIIDLINGCRHCYITKIEKL